MDRYRPVAGHLRIETARSHRRERIPVAYDRSTESFFKQRCFKVGSVRIDQAIRKLASRLPTYITLKDVKKRWGHAQEDIFPVSQFEKLWGDMTTLPEARCEFFVVPTARGQQMKDPAQLDGWVRDGSSEYINALCDW